MICTGHVWSCVLEDNPVFWELASNIVSLLVGVLAIMFGITKISDIIKGRIAEAKVAASFGFYVNFLAYLKQMELFLNELHLNDVFQLLVKPDVREECFGLAELSTEAADAIAPAYAEFCKNFLSFLSSSENNIPPDKQSDNRNVAAKWREWRTAQTRMIEFLHKGLLIDKVYWYTSADQIEDYNNSLSNIRADCTRISLLIEEYLPTIGH